jgi:protein-S-isoprenylcysteine O-methyltransferase Ste14
MISITNMLGILLGLGTFFVLLSFDVSPIWAVSLGITVFHVNMLLLYAFLFSLLRKHDFFIPQGAASD